MLTADVLFYTHSARAFTSSLIGHLYEVCQRRSVVLLAEPLRADYLALLARHDLFPGLAHVETVSGLGFTFGEVLRGNRRWLRLARESLDTYRPRLVIAENDMSSLFEMYLLREAKTRGVPCLTIQALGQVRDVENQKLLELLHVYAGGDNPSRAKALWRLWRCRTRKRLGSLLVHYLLPWSAGQPAFRGPASYVRMSGAPGMRDTTLHLVQSLPQYQAFLDSRVDPARLALLKHPLHRVPLDVFFPAAPAQDAHRATRRFLVLMSACKVGFARDSYRPIFAEERTRLRLEIIDLIRCTLPDWEVVVKAHPDFGSGEAVRQYLRPVADAVTIHPPNEPVEPLLPSADAILDLPAPWTSTLVTASSAFPGKPVIAADLARELVGDQYRAWREIDYVDDMASLRALLSSIRTGQYSKRTNGGPVDGGVREFRDTNDAVGFVMTDAGR